MTCGAVQLRPPAGWRAPTFSREAEGDNFGGKKVCGAERATLPSLRRTKDRREGTRRGSLEAAIHPPEGSPHWSTLPPHFSCWVSRTRPARAYPAPSPYRHRRPFPLALLL